MRGCSPHSPGSDVSEEPIRYSVVIPLRDEEGNVEPLWRELTEVMSELGEPYELIFVDDGSTDGTFQKLSGLYERDARVHVIRLCTHFGQTAALAAGFDFAQGEIVITMDGDLQYDPRDIPRLVQKLAQGYDLVSGWRRRRSDAFWTRRLPSRVANWLIARLSGVPLRDFGSTFKAYRREALASIRLYGDQHRFIPALISQWWDRLAEIPVRVRPRRWGRSKYGLSRTLRVLFDLVTMTFLLRHLARPLHFFGKWGAVAFALGLGLEGYLLEEEILGHAPLLREHGLLLLLGLLLLITGMQLISLGLIGEVLSRTYYESQRKPIYAIREIHSRRRGASPKRAERGHLSERRARRVRSPHSFGPARSQSAPPCDRESADRCPGSPPPDSCSL